MAKQTFKITNRATYNYSRALVNWGSLTSWLDESALIGRTQNFFTGPPATLFGTRYHRTDAQTCLSSHATRCAGIYGLYFYPDEASAALPGGLLRQQAG